jgi:hypothetical protein
VCGLLARFGGWQALGKKYKSSGPGSGRSFRFSSVALGPGRFPATYRACVAIEVGEDGIALRVLPLFRIGHPQLLIPWSAVAECKPDWFFFQPCTTLNLADPRTRLRIPGQAGQEVLEFWKRRG